MPEAEQALGQDFDIREFHHQILRHGSVPMSVLEEQIQLYIKAELAKQQHSGIKKTKGVTYITPFLFIARNINTLYALKDVISQRGLG